jgi:Predicted metal-binding integral membrane protein (DUF2182)
MGIEHGGYCVGCSWALKAALFALGVMSGSRRSGSRSGRQPASRLSCTGASSGL